MKYATVVATAIALAGGAVLYDYVRGQNMGIETCRKYGVIEFGTRRIENNVGGAPYSEFPNFSLCINTNCYGSFGWKWNRPYPQMKPGNTWLEGLWPNVLIGQSPWNNGDGRADSASPSLPVKVANIQNATLKLGYKYLQTPTTGQQNGFDLAYDMFFLDNITAPTDGRNIKTELMIWIHAVPFPTWNYKYDITIDGITYAYFNWTTGSGMEYNALVMKSPPKYSQTYYTLNLKNIINYMISIGKINPEHYLSSVQFGSEIYEGSGNILVNQFIVNINGNNL